MFAAKSPPIPLYSPGAFFRTVDSPCLLTVWRLRTSCDVVSLGTHGVRERKFGAFLRAIGQDGLLEGLDESPMSVELETIGGESEFDRVIAEAQQLEESVVVVWMASWCRKCIYLKPKLEKLAADYYPRLRFYCVDVNKVPHRLVTKAGVTKMPTIQLWKDGNKQAEVIGGHKAYLVVDEVREMIENEQSA